jgi:hypothetical protein
MLSIKLKLFGIRLSLAGDGIGVHTVFIIHRCWRNEAYDLVVIAWPSPTTI